MKQSLLFILLFPLLLQAQDLESVNLSHTTISLNYGANHTYNVNFESSAIGGEWGLIIDHTFASGKFGLSAGINYSLINIGDQAGLVESRFAWGFGVLESAFGIFIIPFQEASGFRIKAGYTHGLVVNDQDYYLDSYNIPIPTFGIEYDFNLKSNLALCIGWNNKYFSLNEYEFSKYLTNVLYCKVGIGR